MLQTTLLTSGHGAGAVVCRICIHRTSTLRWPDLDVLTAAQNEQHERASSHHVNNGQSALQVTNDGTVMSLPGHENFPDTQAKVLGAEVGSLPDMLTS